MHSFPWVQRDRSTAPAPWPPWPDTTSLAHHPGAEPRRFTVSSARLRLSGRE